ncbi:MAG: peroxide stress protein YaaA, partial [Vallitaleaceae bacterium]|nr:peroxide stress protein YaaA [Vallitaleaceae bacterium]
HLRILSGFYGSLRPLDSIIPYRLEMQAPLHVGKYENLYTYWNHLLYDELYHENNLVINLASKEYSQCLRPYLKEKDQFIDLHFLVRKNSKLTVKATYAKMARGAMVRFMAERQIKTPEGLKDFQEFGYSYDMKLSKESELYFVKEE